MRRCLAALLLAAAGFPGLAQAQAPAAAVAPAPAVAAAPIAAPDPARLAAARELIDVLMPPETRERMIESMIAPMLGNLQQGMTQSPMFSSAMAEHPEMQTQFAAFLERQQKSTMTLMRAGLPGMIEAMARAYARRFDVAQCRDIKAFFATPSGRAYMQQSLTIMSDPDVAAWQRSMMQSSMANMQADVAEFAKEAAKPEAKTK